METSSRTTNMDNALFVLATTITVLIGLGALAVVPAVWVVAASPVAMLVTAAVWNVLKMLAPQTSASEPDPWR